MLKVRSSHVPCTAYLNSLHFVHFPNVCAEWTTVLCLNNPKDCEDMLENMSARNESVTIKQCARLSEKRDTKVNSVERKYCERQTASLLFVLQTRYAVLFFCKISQVEEVKWSASAAVSSVLLFEILLELAFLNTQLKSTHQLLLVICASCGLIYVLLLHNSFLEESSSSGMHLNWPTALLEESNISSTSLDTIQFKQDHL